MNTVELWPSLSGIEAEVSSGNRSAVSQVKKALLRIADSNDTYNAVLQTIETRALKRAEEIDAAIARGESVGKLAGVPFLAKDNYLTFGSATTAGSNMLKGFKAP